MRSNPENTDHLDVSEIAKAFGGGGHPNAAGFNRKFHEIDLNTFFDKTIKEFEESLS
jgi:nanoRNase/pAp phosphatase (c-di-AMP/oligoRNAs hydrolase)